MKRRTVEQIKAEIEQHNRNISWTCGRSGLEGQDVSRETMKFMVEKGRSLQKELEEAERVKK